MGLYSGSWIEQWIAHWIFKLGHLDVVQSNPADTKRFFVLFCIYIFPIPLVRNVNDFCPLNLDRILTVLFVPKHILVARTIETVLLFRLRWANSMMLGAGTIATALSI